MIYLAQKIKNHKTIKAKHQNGDFEMAYEIDFIGVNSEKSTKDADAICMRWRSGVSFDGTATYKIGVVDGGFEAHGDALVAHMNQYYFNDELNIKDITEKSVDFIVITHPDQDHTIGIKKVLENFSVKKIYMNRPWKYVDDLFDKINDGRITKESLARRLREKYKTIADIEDMAKEKNIPIYEAFEGTHIEDELLILSPEKQYYLSLLVSSEKTPLEMSSALQHDGTLLKLLESVKDFALNILETWDIETLRESETTSAENETSVILRGKVDGSGFILTGDAGIGSLNRAIDYMEKIGENIVEDISFYQVPHHGGRHNVSPSVLNRMLGEKIEKGNSRNKVAFASVAQNSSHPLKMVTNAYIRRGVTIYKTNGNVICHHNGKMPDRRWVGLKSIEFSDYVEEWSN